MDAMICLILKKTLNLVRFHRGDARTFKVKIGTFRRRCGIVNFGKPEGFWFRRWRT
jgi:hypothetical protein